MHGIKNIAKLLIRVGRWKAYRGGWLMEYRRNHVPFDLHRVPGDTPIDVVVAVADHFEPPSKRGPENGADSVRRWCDSYARMVEGHRDSDGVCPQHTWFHRFEYLNEKCMEVLSRAVFGRLGEVEFHLHHGFDDHASFSAKLKDGLDLANRYGAMLTAESKPQRRFAYVAGNWSLDNGSGNPALSGCNTELAALRQAGCYADFTFPAIGSKAQPRKSNAIYYATDCPKPKSYNQGVDVRVGGQPTGDLMIVQGPSLLDWKNGRFESAALESYAPPDEQRVKNWLNGNIHVQGRPEWIFVKLHTHGVQSREAWFGEQFGSMFQDMEQQWNRPPFRLHYASVREMYNMIRAAEAGHSGNPNDFRDFVVPPPINRRIYCDRPTRFLRCDGDHIELELLDTEKTTIRFAESPVKSVSGHLDRVQLDYTGMERTNLKIWGNGEFDIDAESSVQVWNNDLPAGEMI